MFDRFFITSPIPNGEQFFAIRDRQSQRYESEPNFAVIYISARLEQAEGITNELCDKLNMELPK